MSRQTISSVVLFLSVLLCLSTNSYASDSTLPKLSDKALVSIVTCSATPDYEGGFGHSSLRIQDAELKIDVVFNFGTYSTQQSFFVYKIFLGTVISSLDGEAFSKFAHRYKTEKRGMNEYYLNLSQQQKQSLWEELNRILLTGERFYKFKVPTNNCSTQLRDVLFKQCGWDKSQFLNQYTGRTYRDVEQGDPLENCWLHLLFNLTCSDIDKEINIYEAAFNPNGLINLLSEVRQDDQPVLMASHRLFPPTLFKQSPNVKLSLSTFLILLIIASILTYLQVKKGRYYIWFDRILLFISGIFGCFLFSLVLFSEIEQLRTNYNLFWALPTNLILAFILKKNNPKWVKVWIQLTCISFLLFPVAAIVGGQYIPTEAYLFTATLLISMLPYSISKRKVL